MKPRPRNDEEIARIWCERNMPSSAKTDPVLELQTLLAIVRAEERERCARTCDLEQDDLSLAGQSNAAIVAGLCARRIRKMTPGGYWAAGLKDRNTCDRCHGMGQVFTSEGAADCPCGAKP